MNFWTLFAIIGVGATVDAMAAGHNPGRTSSPVVVIVAASILLFILAIIGSATNRWGIVSALASIYLLVSLLENFQHIPSISKALTKGK